MFAPYRKQTQESTTTLPREANRYSDAAEPVSVYRAVIGRAAVWT